MPEYIEREAAYPLAKKICDAIDKVPRCILGQDILDFIDDIPAADVRPVVRGEWEHTEDFDEYGGGRYVEWTCSVCFSKAKGGWAVRHEHIDDPPTWNFCPNCGADMREES